MLALALTIPGAARAAPVAQRANCKLLNAAVQSPLPPPKKTQRTAEEWNQIAAERTCFKNYPWPIKLMVVEDKLGMVTPGEMHSILKEVEALVVEYQKFGKNGFTRHSNTDTVARHFYAEVEKRDLNLLQKFGYTLYIQVLATNNLLDEAKAAVDEAFSKWRIAVRDVPWDEGDYGTYFSDATLDKILFLLKYYVYSQGFPSSRDEALTIADEYLKARPLLANEIRLLFDPAEELLANAGCR
jgi:hypothetical protein